MKCGTARLRSGASTVREAPHAALAVAQAAERHLLLRSAAPHRVSKNATSTSDDQTASISSASRSFTGSSRSNPPQLASTSSERAIQASTSSAAIASEHANANAPEAGNCSRKKKKKTKRRRTTPTPVGWPPSPGIHLDERSVKRLANEEVIKQEQAQAIKTKEQPDDERTYSSDRDSDEANLRNFLQQLPVDFTYPCNLLKPSASAPRSAVSKAAAGSEVVERQPQAQNCRKPISRSRSRGRSSSKWNLLTRKSRSHGFDVACEKRRSSRKRRTSPSKKRSPSRDRGRWYTQTGSQVFVRLNEGLVQRPATGREPWSPFDSLTARHPTQELPASVGVGNFMVATWALGRQCDVQEFGHRLCIAPSDLTVLVMSSQVTSKDRIHRYLSGLVDSEASRRDESTWSVLAEKSVRCVVKCETTSVFIAIHKAKVISGTYIQNDFRSRGPQEEEVTEGIHFGTLKLVINQERQKHIAEVSHEQREHIVTVGIVVVRTEVTKRQLDALAAWVILERIDMLTGFFGNSETTSRFVTDLATRTNAISSMPMYQGIKVGQNSWAHPSFFMFFGFYHKIKVPDRLSNLPENCVLGEDIWNDLMLEQDMPCWKKNDHGRALVLHLGDIMMKPPDFEARWFSGCYQTLVWLGGSIPSKSSTSSQRKQLAQDKFKGYGNCEGKGQGKGKGKGQGKGKGKGKGKG